MVNVTLTPEEAGTLSEVLDSCVSDLRMEIANTDSLDFREQLKQREELLKRLLEQLASANAS